MQRIVIYAVRICLGNVSSLKSKIHYSFIKIIELRKVVNEHNVIQSPAYNYSNHTSMISEKAK